MPTLASAPAPARRPPAQVLASRDYPAGKPCVLAEQIGHMVCDLWTRKDPREFSRVIARRLAISEARVDRILAGLFLKRDRTAAALAEAARNGLLLSAEAGRDVWREGAA